MEFISRQPRRANRRSRPGLGWGLAVLLTLAGCAGGCAGGGGDGGGADGAALEGSAVKGPVNGGDVAAYALANGVTGSVLARAVTGPDGAFRLDLGAYAGPVLVEVTGGTYTDEATGTSRTLPDTAGSGLTAVTAAVDPGVPLFLATTPLTTLATARARALPGGLTADNIRAANAELGHYFGLDLTATRPADPTRDGAAALASPDAMNYGLTLAGLSEQARDLGLADPMALVAALARDIEDGVFDGRANGAPVPLEAGSLKTGAGSSELAAAIAAFADDPDRNRSGAVVGEIHITFTVIDGELTIGYEELNGGLPPDQLVEAIRLVEAGTLERYLPAAPAGLTASPAGAGSAMLSWQPVAGATSYNVYFNRGDTVSRWDDRAARATSPYLLTGLTHGATYRVAVAAVNDVGEGPMGNAAKVYVNTAPVMGSGGSYTTGRDVPVTGRLDAFDADGDSLTLEVVEDPVLGRVETDGTGFTYIPDPGVLGNDAFRLRASDGVVVSDTARVDITIATVMRVSTDSLGRQLRKGGNAPVTDAVGRVTAFVGGSTGLTDPAQAMAKDLATGALEPVSVDAGGQPANAVVGRLSVSADGRRVAFTTEAGNLGAGPGGPAQIYVRDRATGTTVIASTDDGGTPGNAASIFPVLDARGEQVVFSSLASNLVPDDTNGVRDMFVKNLVTGAVRRVSTTADGSELTATSFLRSDFSADGRFVAFATYEDGLAAGDANGRADVFRKDLASGALTLVSAAADGTAVGGEAPAISADGRFVVFRSPLDVPEAHQAFFMTHVWRKDMETGEMVNAGLVGIGVIGTSLLAYGDGPDISADGRFISYRSGEADGVRLVDLREPARAWTLDNHGIHLLQAALSADGRFLMMASSLGSLVSGDTNGATDVFRIENPFSDLDPEADDDGDGLGNRVELTETLTFHFRADSDGDGVDDGAEVAAGADPMDPADTPVP